MGTLNIESLFGDRHPHASFHDSTINKVNIDFLTREVKFDCLIDIGDPSDTAPEPKQAYGVLTLKGLLYIAVEPPFSDYSYEEGGLDITYDGSVEATNFRAAIPKLPELNPDGAFAHCFFISNWNSFMFVAATGAMFEWI
jgi:hypothetical protein